MTLGDFELHDIWEQKTFTFVNDNAALSLFPFNLSSAECVMSVGITILKALWPRR